MKLTIALSSTHFDELEIQQLTRDLLNSLRDEPNINAYLAELPAQPGSKGDAITTGTIVMALIGSGGVAVSLLNILKAYVVRGRNIKIKVKNSEGKQVELQGLNLSSSHIQKTTDLLKELLGELD